MGRAPTVSNNGKARIEKKKMGFGGKKTLSSTNMERSDSKEERRANSVLHCCSDNNHNGKSWPGLEIQFLANIPTALSSTHNWVRGPLWGSGWGFRAYIGMQSAHFRAIYSYI